MVLLFCQSEMMLARCFLSNVFVVVVVQYMWHLRIVRRQKPYVVANFAFEDSLQVLETLWASLPPSYADKEGLILYEVKLNDGSQDKVRNALF